MAWIHFDNVEGGFLNLDFVVVIERHQEPDGPILILKFVQGDTLTVKRADDEDAYDQLNALLARKTDTFEERVVTTRLRLKNKEGGKNGRNQELYG